jgi:hypothetical protein
MIPRASGYWSGKWRSRTAHRCWPRCKARWMPAPPRRVVRRRYVRNAAIRCAAKTHGRSPGWRVADACMLPCRVTAARLAAMSAGPLAGSAGHRGAVSAGGTSGWVAVGCHHQPHGHLAGGAAVGRSGGASYGCLEPVSCRQPQYRRSHANGPLGRSVGSGWLQLGNAGTFHTAAPSQRRTPATIAPRGGRSFP